MMVFATGRARSIPCLGCYWHPCLATQGRPSHYITHSLIAFAVARHGRKSMESV